MRLVSESQRCGIQETVFGNPLYSFHCLLPSLGAAPSQGLFSPAESLPREKEAARCCLHPHKGLRAVCAFGTSDTCSTSKKPRSALVSWVCETRQDSGEPAAWCQRGPRSSCSLARCWADVKQLLEMAPETIPKQEGGPGPCCGQGPAWPGELTGMTDAAQADAASRGYTVVAAASTF